MAWTGFVWIRIETRGELLYMWSLTSGFREVQGINGLAEELRDLRIPPHSWMLVSVGWELVTHVSGHLLVPSSRSLGPLYS